jgi:plasmid stabilization system protein ParE
LKRIRIQAAAYAEADAAAAWYEARQPGLGTECVLELDAAITRAAEQSQVYATQYGDVRHVLMRRFSCAIYFFPDGEAIEILAILHQRRDIFPWPS